MTNAYYDHLWKLKRNLKLLRENVPPHLENYQAMYDKEQRLTEGKSVRPSENVLTVLVLQQEQHEEFLTLQLALLTGQPTGLFTRNSAISTTAAQVFLTSLSVTFLG